MLHRDLNEAELKWIQTKGTCPFCKTGKYLAGPEGGGSQNILCNNCGTELCYAGFFANILERNEKRAYFYGLDALPNKTQVDITVPMTEKKNWFTKAIDSFLAY